jgi:hypothetical protein
VTSSSACCGPATRCPTATTNVPKPPVVALPVKGGGGVKVALTPTGPKYQAGMPPSVIERLELDGPTEQERLSAIVEDRLETLPSPDSDAVRELARRGQPLGTPPDAWSRFMAKIGLACGRDAYGDAWLDTRQAKILSDDLLRGHRPRFAQRLVPAWSAAAPLRWRDPTRRSSPPWAPCGRNRLTRYCVGHSPFAEHPAGVPAEGAA